MKRDSFMQKHGFLGRQSRRSSRLINLTAAGLSSNLELNLGHYDEPLDKVEKWYDEVWEEAVPLILLIFMMSSFKFSRVYLFEGSFQNYTAMTFNLKMTNLIS